ncbi:MAG: nucleoside-diphosphate-sugar epimerase [Chloroflexota bacterium]|nr:MAG: nucleoside-diphosphate-sugar epimerase [Chloroflexota bacterium]
MRVLVTGGAGFIGSHTVDLLLRKGYAVRILDSLAAPVHEEGIVPDYVPREAEFLRGDVRDADAWKRALRDVDAVIHLAAYQDYLTDFSKFFHVNTVGTALLYETLVEDKLPIQKVIVASSQATYGEGKYICRQHPDRRSGSHTPHAEIFYPMLRSETQLKLREWEVYCPVCNVMMEWALTDETQVNPHNQYAMSKYTQEMVALNLGRRYNIPTTCMRYSIVQGKRQSFRNAYSGILRNFTQRLLAGNPPVCYEDGLQVRDYVYVGDVARANVLALQEARANFQVYNVGGERPVTVLEYAELLARKINASLAPQIPGLYRFGDTRHIVSDVAKLKTLGWTPTKRVDEIADEYIAWACEQPGLRDYYVAAEAAMLARGALRVAA